MYEAMAGLLAKARRQAEGIALTARGQHPERDVDAEWPFKVIDMPLIPGHAVGQREAWLAYGTLVSTGGSSWSSNCWDHARR